MLPHTVREPFLLAAGRIGKIAPVQAGAHQFREAHARLGMLHVTREHPAVRVIAGDEAILRVIDDQAERDAVDGIAQQRLGPRDAAADPRDDAVGGIGNDRCNGARHRHQPHIVTVVDACMVQDGGDWKPAVQHRNQAPAMLVVRWLRPGAETPPPLEGGGLGEGSTCRSLASTPPPNPFPQGEGEVLLLARTRPRSFGRTLRAHERDCFVASPLAMTVGPYVNHPVVRYDFEGIAMALQTRPKSLLPGRREPYRSSPARITASMRLRAPSTE